MPQQSQQSVTVVVGNPKVDSRTRDAGIRLASELMRRPPDTIIELSELGRALLSWGDPLIEQRVQSVAETDLLVVASPTFKATYSGLLKLFLDQFAGGTGLAGVVCAPLMLGAGPAHTLAPELTLRPVLTELGGTCALPGLYLIDSTYTTDQVLESYAERWRPTLRALIPTESEHAQRGRMS